MPLPKVSTPVFELDLISSNKKIKYRPFLVKEEKSLLIALESGEEKTILNTLKNVLKSCVISRVKIDELPSFDLEFLFLNIRGKSVGESVELLVTCEDDGETQVPLTIQMSDIKLDIPDEHTDTIDLGDDLHLKMKYPSFSQFAENNFFPSKVKDDLLDKAFGNVVDCIDQIYNLDEAWSGSDCTKKELMDFIEQLSSSQFQKIEEFFTSMPKLVYKTTVTNPNTKKDNKIVIEGLSNFFA
ncbi:MAG TPA: baseplate protein [Tenacibaculum sp.]|nr:baseplate protein [Tenacibaculum sp.]